MLNHSMLVHNMMVSRKGEVARSLGVWKAMGTGLDGYKEMKGWLNQPGDTASTTQGWAGVSWEEGMWEDQYAVCVCSWNTVGKIISRLHYLKLVLEVRSLVDSPGCRWVCEVLIKVLDRRALIWRLWRRAHFQVHLGCWLYLVPCSSRTEISVPLLALSGVWVTVSSF